MDYKGKRIKIDDGEKSINDGATVGSNESKIHLNKNKEILQKTSSIVGKPTATAITSMASTAAATTPLTPTTLTNATTKSTKSLSTATTATTATTAATIPATTALATTNLITKPSSSSSSSSTTTISTSTTSTTKTATKTTKPKVSSTKYLSQPRTTTSTTTSPSITATTSLAKSLPTQSSSSSSTSSLEKLQTIVHRELEIEAIYKDEELRVINCNIDNCLEMIKIIKTRLVTEFANEVPNGHAFLDLKLKQQKLLELNNYDPEKGNTNKNNASIRMNPQEAETASDIPLLASETAKINDDSIASEKDTVATRTSEEANGGKFDIKVSKRLYRKVKDGFVWLICPICNFERFIDINDIIKHCLTLHNLVCVDEDDVIEKCGRSVPDEEVPSYDNCRKPLKSGVLEKDKIAELDKNIASEDSEVHFSRFYVTKTVIVGNTSKYIPAHLREENDPSTHKWMVYVRTPHDHAKIETFIKKAWFFLHPSYKPNDVVEINSPPFHLTRHGWGEFPVRVQLYFHDSRTKPVDIIHNLKLDRTYKGSQTLGAETTCKIEIDRRTMEEHHNSNNNDSSKDTNMNNSNNNSNKIEEQNSEIEESPMKTSIQRFGQKHKGLISITNGSSEDSKNSDKANKQLFGTSATLKNRYDAMCETLEKDNDIVNEHPLEKIFNEAVKNFPMINNDPNNQITSISQADSLAQFLGWSQNKQRAAEWLRAREVKSYIEKLGHSMTISEIEMRCRELGFTPISATSSLVDRPPLEIHCRFCGCSHITDHDTSSTDQALCATGLSNQSNTNLIARTKKGKVFLSSLSSSEPLVSELVSIDDEEEDIDLDLDIVDADDSIAPVQYIHDPTLPDEVSYIRYVCSKIAISLSSPPVSAVNSHSNISTISGSNNRRLVGHADSNSSDTQENNNENQDNFVVEKMLFASLRIFANRLFSSAVAEMEKSPIYSNATQDVWLRNTAIVTPLHIYQAVCNDKTQGFDLLSNSYLGNAPPPNELSLISSSPSSLSTLSSSIRRSPSSSLSSSSMSNQHNHTTSKLKKNKEINVDSQEKDDFNDDSGGEDNGNGSSNNNSNNKNNQNNNNNNNEIGKNNQSHSHNNSSRFDHDSDFEDDQTSKHTSHSRRSGNHSMSSGSNNLKQGKVKKKRQRNSNSTSSSNGNGSSSTGKH